MYEFWTTGVVLRIVLKWATPQKTKCTKFYLKLKLEK